MIGNQSSAGHLLWLVRSGRATTRGELQRATGLSRSTVGHRLDRLFRAGWLRHGDTVSPGGPTGGRPSRRLEFDGTHAAVLAVDLEVRYGRAAVLDLTGAVLAEHTGPLRIEDGPEP
ncbi:MAG TPA: sugar kinase, partial [Streptomyces sp.]|nr:sugar kinase [Streptomyces sp.]